MSFPSTRAPRSPAEDPAYGELAMLTVATPRKGVARVVIEDTLEGRLLIATVDGRRVAEARMVARHPDLPAARGEYIVTLANGRLMGAAWGWAAARLQLVWAGAYFLRLEAKGLL
jgi:hypothetical protein